jgi:OOP family OmpA-OmpF porin
MKQHFRHSLKLATAALFASTSLAVRAGDGPYIGIEGGTNSESSQNLIQNGNVLDTLQFKNGWTIGLIGGYALPNGLRPELAFDHRRNQINGDSHGADVNGFQNADSIFANLWYDFRMPSGLLHVYHPYLGGGLGGVRFDTRNVTVNGVDFGNDYIAKLGYQAGAGMGVDLTPQLTLSADYRYLQSNRGSFAFGPEGLVDARYRTQTALLGLRYSFAKPPVAAPPPVQQAAVPPPPPPPLPPPPPPCKPPAGFKVDANCHVIAQTVVVRAVDFEFNSVQLTVPAQQTLDEVAGALLAQPELFVEISGHTDSIGSAAYNLKLSQRRAEAVKDYLVGKGLKSNSLTVRGYGKSSPIASNATEQGRAENRRVEFVVANSPPHVDVIHEKASAASTEAAKLGKQPKKAATKRPK